MPNEKHTTGPVMIYAPAPVTHKNFVSLPVVPPPVRAVHAAVPPVAVHPNRSTVAVEVPVQGAVHAAIPPVAVHPNRVSAPTNSRVEQSIKSLFKIYP